VFNNSGTVRVDSGKLNLFEGGADSGAIQVTGSLRLVGGTFTVNSGASFGGPGLLSVAGGSLVVNVPVVFPNFSESGGSLSGGASVTLSNIASWTGGGMGGAGTTIVPGGAVLTISGTTAKQLTQRSMSVAGTINHTSGDLSLGAGTGTTITIQPSGTYDLATDTNLTGSGANINNQGLFIKSSPSGTGTSTVSAAFTNSGTMRVDSGTLQSQQSYAQTRGLTTIATGATLQTATLQLVGGTLGGTGTIIGDVTSASAVSPGFSPGLLTVIGNYAESRIASFAIELNGATAGTQYDQLEVNGTISLSGTLAVTPGYAAAIGTPFVIIDNDGSSPVNGTFANLPEGTQITVGGQTFTISYHGGDGNDVVLTRADLGPPTVGGLQVNDGLDQRSEVRSIAVTFSGPVTFAGGNGNAAAAFELQHVQTGNNVALGATDLTDSQGRTVVTLSFSGAETDAVSAINGGALSLVDGRYQLTILSANVTGANSLALMGGGPSGNYVTPAETTQGPGLHLFRLFGDATGNGTVDPQDLGQFRTTYNANAVNPLYLSYLDADNSGSVDPQDLGQFRARFNASVFAP
jgi:hypothetical protein